MSAAAVETALPRGFFVMRGHVMTAFGLTKEEMSALVEQGVFAAEYPFGKSYRVRSKAGPKTVKARMRFVRSKVVAVARRWEATA